MPLRICNLRDAGWCEPERDMLYSEHAEIEAIRCEGQEKGGLCDGFGKISAVEGIRLTPAMKKRATDAEREGLSAEEYRKTIERSYRKA